MQLCLLPNFSSKPKCAPEWIIFQVKSGGSFGAFGLSTDDKMGDDLVFLCSSTGVTPYWNEGKSPQGGVGGVTIAAGEQASETVDSRTVCSFMVDEKLMITPPGADAEREYNLKDTKYFLLVATGREDSVSLLVNPRLTFSHI